MNLTKKAIITGVTGQDGRILGKILLREGYQVLGTTRKLESSKVEPLLESGIQIIETDYSTQHLEKILSHFQPDEAYHLAGQTFVGRSWLVPEETLSSCGLIAARFLELLCRDMPPARFFNASSSEIYFPKTGQLAETDPKEPTNPYGCAKLLSHQLVNAYRNNFGLFAVNGILFNHESSLRQNQFFSKKLVSGVVDIVEGKTDQIKLGSLDITRDWGDSEEYMEAVFRIVQHDTPEDFNICSGVGVSVGEIVDAVFNAVSLSSQKHVVLNTNLVRAKENRFVVGDPGKINRILGWRAQSDIFTVVKKMLNDEFNRRGLNESV